MASQSALLYRYVSGLATVSNITSVQWRTQGAWWNVPVVRKEKV